MPVPAAPRRAAPPRRKKETPKLSDEPPAPSQEEETPTPETKIPLPDSTPNLLTDVEEEKAKVSSDADLKPAHVPEPSSSPNNESPEPTKGSGLVTERSTSPTLVRSGDHDEVPEDARAPSPLKEDHLTPPLSEEKLAEVVEEGKMEIEEYSGIDQPGQGPEEPLNQASSDEEPAKPLGTVLEKGEESEVRTTRSEVEKDAEVKPEEQLEEEEEDEATRRARITARLANSGGFNPFAGDPPARKPSESSLPERRTSVESPGPLKPTVHEEQELPTQPLARRDVDPLENEDGLLTTETTEGDEPFYTPKQAKGDF